MVHVSFDIISEFKPRVPKNRCEGEDNKIPRICVSKNLIGAIRGMPQGADTVLAMEKLKIPIIIHAYYLTSNNVVSSENLLKRKLVPDVLNTHEMWITTTPTSIYRVDYKVENADIIDVECVDGVKRKYLLNANFKRVKYQDNWEIFAKRLKINNNSEAMQRLSEITHDYRLLVVNFEELRRTTN